MFLFIPARVNTPPLGAHQIPCPIACGGAIDFMGLYICYAEGCELKVCGGNVINL